MNNATFFNFDIEPFQGWWNGRSKTFQPGEKVRMPAYLAEHFAKHLSNKVLIRRGLDTYTSPKKPADVPIFMDEFKKTFIPDAVVSGETELDAIIASAEQPSMDVRPKKSESLDQGPAAALSQEKRKPQAEELDVHNANDPRNAPGGVATVIGEATEGDEGEFEMGTEAPS